VQSVCSDLVHVDPNSSILSINTTGIIAYLVEAVKTLDEMIYSLLHPVQQPAQELDPELDSPKEAAIWLCSQANGVLTINDRALDFIRILPSVTILSVCGPRRTGKSFFLQHVSTRGLRR